MNRALAAALALLALSAPAASLDGVYGAACEPVGDVYPMTIDGDSMRFYQTRCHIAEREALPGMEEAFLVTLRCVDQGETREDRAFLQQSWSGGLILAWRGTAITLPRCE